MNAFFKFNPPKTVDDGFIQDGHNNNRTKYVKVEEYRSFKQKKSFAQRKMEVANIRAKFPHKVPVIVERYHKELALPMLDKTKFLVPQELSMSQFIQIIRNRMQLTSTQAFYVLVNNRSLAAMSKTMLEIYNENRDPDGFLYVCYASQEVFG